MANGDESLTRHSELSDAIDLELLHLPVHVGEEDTEVLWNLLVADKVFCVVAGVEFRDQIFASLINFHDCFWESQILLCGVLEPNGAEVLELVRLPGLIDLSLRLLELDTLLYLQVRDPLQVLRVVRLPVDGLEPAQMLAIVDHHANQGDKVDPDLDAQRLLLLAVVSVSAVTVEGLEVEHFELFE